MGLPFRVSRYPIAWSHEVDGVVEAISREAGEQRLIQIASYMHNTVLVQSLVSKLSKRFPETGIVQIGAERSSGTVVTLFRCDVPPQEGEDALACCSRMLLYSHKEESQRTKELAACKEQLLRRHFVDPLTNLPNLYQLRDDLDHRHDTTFVALNIDNFKLINDFYGFVVGDYILEQTAMKIVALAKGMPVYRLYGDEFGLLIEKKMPFYELKNYLDTLNLAFKNLCFEYERNCIYVDITMASSAGSSHSRIFSKVSMALKYAKEMRLPYWIYEDHMHFEHAYENNLKIAVKIRNAIENSGIVPYFQPIVCNQSGEIRKFECLSRLIDDKGNVLPPKMFIDVAKTIKVYNQVTRSIIEKSFEVFRHNDYDFSVNLSIEDVMNHEIFDFIIAKLKAAKFGPRVTFELLESESVEDFRKVARFITEIKRYGAKVAIDDFGSGFSNFVYLTEIDVDYIKIDGSLIENIDRNPNSELVVRTIVGFARNLGIKTIAEYVHSSTVLSTVKRLGVDYAQGYYIDQPLPQLPSEAKE